MIRHLALGISTSKPSGWIGQFLNSFIKTMNKDDLLIQSRWKKEYEANQLLSESNSIYGLNNDLFTAAVISFIYPDGSLDESLVRNWKTDNSLDFSIFRFQTLTTLVKISGVIEMMNPCNEGQTLVDLDLNLLQKIEDISKKIFNKYGINFFGQTSSLKLYDVVYNYEGNKANRMKIEQNICQSPNGNKNFPFWYCTLLKLMWNYYIDNLNNVNKLKQLTKSLPLFTIEWLNAISLLKSFQESYLSFIERTLPIAPIWKLHIPYKPHSYFLSEDMPTRKIVSEEISTPVLECLSEESGKKTKNK